MNSSSISANDLQLRSFFHFSSRCLLVLTFYEIIQGGAKRFNRMHSAQMLFPGQNNIERIFQEDNDPKHTSKSVNRRWCTYQLRIS